MKAEGSQKNRKYNWIIQGIVLAIIAVLLNAMYQYLSNRDIDKLEAIRAQMSNNAKRLVATIDPNFKPLFTKDTWESSVYDIFKSAKELEKFGLTSIDKYDGENCKIHDVCLSPNEELFKYRSLLLDKESPKILIKPIKVPPKSIDYSFKEPLPIPDPFDLCGELKTLQKQSKLNFETLKGKQTYSRYKTISNWNTLMPLIDSWKDRMHKRGYPSYWLQKCYISSYEKENDDTPNIESKYFCEMRINEKIKALKLAYGIQENLKKCLSIDLEFTDEKKKYDAIRADSSNKMKSGSLFMSGNNLLKGIVSPTINTKITIVMEHMEGDNFDHSIFFKYEKFYEFNE